MTNCETANTIIIQIIKNLLEGEFIMNLKKAILSKVSILTIVCLVFALCMTVASFATKADITPAAVGTNVQKPDFSIPPLVNASQFSTTAKVSNSAVTMATTSTTSGSLIAVLTVFADPTSNGSGSSGGDGSSAFGTHAFITVKNVSSSNITVGKFSNIAPGTSMSLGTWGNKSEHKGLWYELEAYFINASSSTYSARVSISYG